MLWWADQSDTEQSRSLLQTRPFYAEEHLTGVFACRAEYRPNPIAVSVCKVLGVDHETGVVRLNDIDAYDGSDDTGGAVPSKAPADQGEDAPC
mgnify:CR=1 FL=1